jgi:hypothetical protein
MAAFNAEGKQINVGDSVTTIATVVSVSGTGQTALVTFSTAWTPNTAVAQAYDGFAVAQAGNPAVSIDGVAFGQSGGKFSPMGVVQSISGSGCTALLSVLLKSSQTLVTVPAGACHSST